MHNRMNLPNMPKFLTYLLLIGFFCSLSATGLPAQDFRISSLEFKGRYEVLQIPFIESSTQPRIARKMNDLFQKRFFETPFTPENYTTIAKESIAYDDEHFHGWTSMTFEQEEITDRYLKFHLDAEYLAAYPSHTSETFLFDLATGLPVAVPTLFSLEGWFDFLNANWLADCFEQLPEAHECGGWDVNESDECYNECYTMEEFFLEKGELELRQTDCYPHVSQACNPYLAKKYQYSELRPYLSDYGKYLLGLSDEQVSTVPPTYFLVGKMDGRINICMALKPVTSEPGRFEGYYYYQRVKQHIPLKGWLKNGKLALSEYIEGNYNGAFSLGWDDFKYSTDGTWENKSGSKTLTVELQSVYEYDNRSLLYH